MHAGISLDDGLSQLNIKPLNKGQTLEVTMYEGRNRQIRRTFAALGYQVEKLHRTHFGKYSLKLLPLGKWINIV
jgi:23S rRNA pseudouridine2605 synthase